MPQTVGFRDVVDGAANVDGAIQVISVTRNGADITVTFEGVQGVTYRLERKLNITDSMWQNIPGVSDLTAANNGPAQITDPGAVSLGKAFYRVNSNQFSLTVTKTGSGVGTVTSSPTGINCGEDCTENYLSGVVVTLTATATTAPLANDSFFAGWGGACSGVGTCMVTMNAAQAVTATFTLKPNVAFVTSTTQTGNMGGLAGADTICQNAANANSIPGTFKAYLSSSTVNAITRLGTASGWVRVDGKPIANSASDFAAGRFFYPLRITNAGVDVGDAVAKTATIGGVLTGTTCGDYTSTSGMIATGTTAGQSGMFSTFGGNSCNTPTRMYCLGIDRAAVAQIVPPPAQRRVFVTTAPWTPGGGLASADALCQSEASGAGLPGTYRALLATKTASAASRFNASGPPWGRVDGALLASTGPATFGGSFWDTSPGVSANGSQIFGNFAVWGGAANPTVIGTAGSTCSSAAGNWDLTSAAGTGTGGRAGYSWIQGFFGSDTNNACNATHIRLTCFQQ